jgi:hypothetical protein
MLDGGDAGAVDERSVGAFQILNSHLSSLEANAGVLPRAQDTVWRFLVFEVDMHRLVTGPTDKV